MLAGSFLEEIMTITQERSLICEIPDGAVKRKCRRLRT